MTADPFDHPDLRDPEWQAKATREARKAARRGGPRRPRKRLSRAAKGVLVTALVLAATATGVYFLRDSQPAGANADMEDGLWSLDRNRPFLHTPAQNWADGVAGIAVPPAAHVGDFTTEQVGKALADVNAILVTGRLDRAVIETGDLDKILAAYAPSERDHMREEALAGGQWQNVYGTKVAPGFRLLPVEPKVSGTMSAEPGERKGELRVRTKFTFAYAFDVDDTSKAKTPLDVVASVRADVTFVIRRGDNWRTADEGVSLETGESSFYSVACGPGGQGLLAPSFAEPPMEATLPKQPNEYFDPNQPITPESNCV